MGQFYMIGNFYPHRPERKGLAGEAVSFGKSACCPVFCLCFREGAQIFATLQNFKCAGGTTPFLAAGLHPIDPRLPNMKNYGLLCVKNRNFLAV